MESPTGMARFAPIAPARGAMFSARKRAGHDGQPRISEAVTEQDLYSQR